MDRSRLRELAISDTGFVFDPVTGHTYNVNPTGLALLRALKADRPLETLGAELRDSFEFDPEDDAERDVGEFVTQLREQGLLR